VRPNPNLTASQINSELNESIKFEVNSIQPQYFLHRDTIKSFFYEKRSLLESGEKTFAYFGVALSTFTSLASSTFNDFWIFKAKHLELGFEISCFISFLLFLKHGYSYWTHKSELSVDALTNELAKRSTAAMIRDPSFK
jgi:hypothetical protein